MFCSKCGKEALGNFCFNCGAPLMIAEAAPDDTGGKMVEDINEAEDIYTEVDGVEINLSEIIEACGNDRIAAIKTLVARTGISLKEGKAIIDEAYDSLSVSQPTKGFWQAVREEGTRLQTEKLANKQLEKERIAQMDREGIAYCPKCYSTSLSAHKKGFGIGKAVVGGIAGVATGGTLGLVGLTAGNMGAKKVRVTCMNCGKQFWAGKK
ncbi:MAG: zinc ribbon domain-containing protein [Eubacteriales bacterium]|nr:zinc ribbon domain-containing protein [Eubacteriales bacterium]